MSGGMDGVLVTFGDGADLDTWETLFGHLAAGNYVVRLTRVDGSTVEGYCTSVVEDGCVVVEVTDDDGEAIGEIAAPLIEQVAGIHIY